MARSSPSHILLRQTVLLIPILLVWTSNSISSTGGNAIACYTSIFCFGDSLADPGNLLISSLSDSPYDLPNAAFPPYGETYFHRPNGRYSDGRLIIDFIAESLGFGLIPPYLSSGRGGGGLKLGEGVNFAVAGATALDAAALKERGIENPYTNNSLGIQLGWFKDLLPNLNICSHYTTSSSPSSNCSMLLQSSLFVVGEIGGNDYNHPFLEGKSLEEIESLVPLVVGEIASTIKELIKLGAVTVMVPGNLPIGCLPIYLTYFKTPNQEEYDSNGCLDWLNKFAEYHNELLRIELNKIQQRHPHTTIMYADFYNAAMRLYRSPNKFGFTRGGLTACCGGGGPYNYNLSVQCGKPEVRGCDNPSLYVSWDGLHSTEAAYKWIAKGLLEDSYTTPPFNSSCLSLAVSAQNSKYI